MNDPSPPLTPTRRQLLWWGGGMMSVWLLIGAAVISEKEPGVPFLLAVIPNVFGFYLWLLTREIGGTYVAEKIFSLLPEPLILIGGLSVGVAFVGMWFLILLLPLFGDWRSRYPTLFLLQNAYSLAQMIGAIAAYRSI